jgi:tripartite-type tricarboxylate transporter receptor subunit TctC
MLRILMAALAFAALAPTQAQAQTYPSRPIRIIVPFPAGGPIDVMARLIGQKLSTGLGTIIIENRPGGGSTVGLKAAASAEPDGHTLLYGGMMTLSVLPSLSKSLDTEASRNFAPVSLVSSAPFVLIVSQRVKAKTLPELIAYAKANPGKLDFGAPAGATPLLVGELFKLKAGVDIQTVPYRGAANVVTDMLTGQIDMAFEPTSVVLAHISEGHVRPLAITGETRSAQLPDVPTMAEAGVDGVVADSWTGLVAPLGTPAPIVAMINHAVSEGLASPDMRAALAKLGAVAAGGPPERFAAYLATEGPKWIEVVKAAGIKVD